MRGTEGEGWGYRREVYSLSEEVREDREGNGRGRGVICRIWLRRGRDGK